jgi:hypothetical protein
MLLNETNWPMLKIRQNGENSPNMVTLAMSAFVDNKSLMPLYVHRYGMCSKYVCYVYMHIIE